MITVAMLLSVAAPVISAVAGAVSYRLVKKRSLRSVDAIRIQVAEITAADSPSGFRRPRRTTRSPHWQ